MKTRAFFLMAITYLALNQGAFAKDADGWAISAATWYVYGSKCNFYVDDIVSAARDKAASLSSNERNVDDVFFERVAQYLLLQIWQRDASDEDRRFTCDAFEHSAHQVRIIAAMQSEASRKHVRIYDAPQWKD